jgi:DNA-binding MarR family transcriptional regulator
MQTVLATERAGPATSESYPALPRGGLKLLLALVYSDGIEAESLKRKLKVADPEYTSLLSVLQRAYLVDVVSALVGDRVHETLRLTEHGESVLTRMMEATCELPE